MPLLIGDERPIRDILGPLPNTLIDAVKNMTVQQLTTSPTETDLEAELRAAIRHAFPLLPQAAIRHQIQFQIKFGHAVYKVDGAETKSARSRADVVLYFGEKPLAILELKRMGEKLQADDGKQGLSYARALDPSPPLVVVTNGTEIRYLATHTGSVWVATEKTEQAFTALMDSAAKVATADLKLAINTLMGTSPSIWMQAVRTATAQNLEELSGDLEDTNKTFGRGFLFERQATAEVLKLLGENRRLILLEGSSLVGKSNVLRELCELTASSEAGATLYIETETGNSILQCIADVLETSLDWPVTADDARRWLKKVSEAEGPDLILAIDGLNTDDRDVRREIEDLSSSKFGARLKLVVALDTTVANRIVVTNGRRNKSPIGNRATRVEVGPLDDEEFKRAVQTMKRHRFEFMNGAFFTKEYRYPWVLRNLAASLIHGLEGEEQHTSLALMPMLSTNLIDYARERFDDITIRREFAKLAQATMVEARDQSRHAALRSEFQSSFVIRRSTLVQTFDDSALESLAEQGYLKETIHHVTDEPVFYVRQPALLASELARLLKVEIISRGSDTPVETATWLIGAAERLPLGDVTVAHALIEAAAENDGTTLGVILTLLKTKPKRMPLRAGTEIVGTHPDFGFIKGRVIGDDEIEIIHRGTSFRVKAGEAIGHLYGDYTPWMILSHVCDSHELIMKGHGELPGIEKSILLQIGALEMPMLQSGALHREMLTHDLPDGSIICHAVGIVEPITQSIFSYLIRDLDKSKEWISLALTRDSGPLLSRIHIALRAIARIDDTSLSTWAKETLTNEIVPAMQRKLPGQEDHLNGPV